MKKILISTICLFLIMSSSTTAFAARSEWKKIVDDNVEVEIYEGGNLISTNIVSADASSAEDSNYKLYKEYRNKIENIKNAKINEQDRGELTKVLGELMNIKSEINQNEELSSDESLNNFYNQVYNYYLDSISVLTTNYYTDLSNKYLIDYRSTAEDLNRSISHYKSLIDEINRSNGLTQSAKDWLKSYLNDAINVCNNRLKSINEHDNSNNYVQCNGKSYPIPNIVNNLKNQGHRFDVRFITITGIESQYWIDLTDNVTYDEYGDIL